MWAVVCLERGFELSVKTFNHTVRDRMVGSSAIALNFKG